MLSQIPARPNAPLFTPALEAAFKPAFHPSYRGIVTPDLGTRKRDILKSGPYPQKNDFGVRENAHAVDNTHIALFLNQNLTFPSRYIRDFKISEFEA